MKLKSLRVQHYKSLSDVYIEFSPTTILVGPNSSGKSNVVDVLRFIRDSVWHGLDHAISERGGIDVLRQYSPTKPYTLSISLEFDQQVKGKGNTASYSLKISGSGSTYRVESEEAQWNQIELTYNEASNSVEITGNDPVRLRRDKHGKVFVNGEERTAVVPSDQLAIRPFASYGDSLSATELAHELGGLRFTAIYPNTLRLPSRPDTDKRLKEDCSNWASILKAMRQRKAGEEALHRVLELMRQVLPGLEQVTVRLIGGYLVPQFLIREKPDSRPHYFDPVQLSDGTLRLFGIFLSLYQVPHPDFLAIEEPELTIHPGLLRLLAEAFKEVSERTQLLVTTHSPYFLDNFEPALIKVVAMKEGETRVSGIRKSQVETVKDGLMTLSEVMALDGLKPD